MTKILQIIEIKCALTTRQKSSSTLTDRIAKLRDHLNCVRSCKTRTVDVSIVPAAQVRLRDAESRQKEAQERVDRLRRDLKEIKQLRGALRTHSDNLEAAEAKERRLREQF